MPKNGPDLDRGLAEEAASWLLSLQSEDLSSAQRAEFVDWLRQSPQHIAQMLRVCQLHRDLARFEGWNTSHGRENVPILRVIQVAANHRARRSRHGNDPSNRGRLLVAGTVAALCIVGLLIFTRPDQTELRTLQGERREMTLADGSVVKMAPESDMVVRYRPNERLLTLKHGEAQFRVAKDSNRPFVVQAAQTRVRAVGTVFDVEYGTEGVSVSVVEGRVAVSQRVTTGSIPSASGPANSLLNLEASEQVSITSAGMISSVRRVPGKAEVAWASDQLTFDNETIAEVVRRFNLRNTLQIEIADPELAARRISGVFNLTEPKSFVAFIEAAAHAQAHERDAQHITVGWDGSVQR